MDDSDYVDVTLNLSGDEVIANVKSQSSALSSQVMSKLMEIKSRFGPKRQSNAFSRRRNLQSPRNLKSGAFSSKVMREMMEILFWDDFEFHGDKKIHNLVKKSTVDDVQFRDNEKMGELMKKQFTSSVDNMPFCGNSVHMMFYELYEVVCDNNADEDRFVDALEQVCVNNEIDLGTIFNLVTPTGDSLLRVAAQHESEQVLLCLIAFNHPKLLYKTNMKGDTPLHLAARAKKLLAIKNILDMDKHFMASCEEEAESMDKVDFMMLRNNYGRTALHEAVLCKDYYAVLYLLFVHKQSDLTSYWTWNYYYDCKSPVYVAVLIRAEDISIASVSSL